MLELAQRLPPAALLGSEGAALDAALAQTGGLRFLARAADLQRSGDLITGWRATDGATLAATSDPNDGNSRFEATPRPALLFREGTNCGFVVPGFADRVEHFTAAVIYTSAGEARTLVSVSTGQAHNQIFLNEKAGVLTAADRAGTVQVDLPSPEGSARRLAVLSYSGPVLALRSGRLAATARAKVPGLDHLADLFIGCRSNRPGIAKTQGAMHLHEVLFWPGRALIGSEAPEDAAALAALDRYFRWAC